MVPTSLGLSFCAAFEELDSSLSRPPIRAYMEKQCCQIADGILLKDDVVDENLKLFHAKFLSFRERLAQVEKFFAPKEQWGGTLGYRGGGGGGGDDGGVGGGRDAWGGQ